MVRTTSTLKLNFPPGGSLAEAAGLEYYIIEKKLAVT